jgi:hypothetical protein
LEGVVTHPQDIKSTAVLHDLQDHVRELHDLLSAT